MVASITINPFQTTVGQGMFADPDTVGLTQGTAYPDPATRWALRTGILSSTETLPMWGGCAIYENIPGVAGAPSSTLGPLVGRATGLTGSKPIAGFSVFDQAYGMVTSPQSPVPLAASYMQVMSYRLGSGARIAVACDPNLVNLRGDPISTPVSWDYANQQLVPYSSTTITAGTYVSATGAASVTTAAAHGLLPGDTFELSALTGTGAFASLDGEWTAIAGTAGTTLNFTATVGLGAATITGGTLATGGILPVSVLSVANNNSMTVQFAPGTGFATWNYNGSAALIQI